MLSLAIWLCAILAVGGSTFYVLVAVASIQHGRRKPGETGRVPMLSVLKPLSGLDLGLEHNLRSYFALDYPRFEILFGVHCEDDPAAAVARAEMSRTSSPRGKLLVVGEPPSTERYPNAKNWNLLQLSEQATGEILVIADSDVRAAAGDLWVLASEFSDSRVGVVTCPYRAIPGPSLWSKLEAIGMNTEFWGGVFVAQFLAPMDFAVGPTMAIRLACLDELGGFEATRDYLAEDFVLGNWARAEGWDVLLSRCVVEHHIGAQSFGANLRHRLRWHRSTRCSRPYGYVAQIFTYPLPFAAALPWLTDGAGWSWLLLGVCVALRLAAALATARTLGDKLVARSLPLLLLQDMLSFTVWAMALFGNEIQWRGRTFRVTRQGRLRAVDGT